MRSCVSHGIYLWKPLLKRHVPLQKEHVKWIVIANLMMMSPTMYESLAEPLIVVFLTMHSCSRFNVFFNGDYVVV